MYLSLIVNLRHAGGKYYPLPFFANTLKNSERYQRGTSYTLSYIMLT